MKIRSLAAIALLGATALAACGSDSDSSADDSATTVASAGETAAESADAATFNEADVSFAQDMIPHHEQAIEMAEMALDPNVGASAEVTALAERIRGGQDPEIELMRGWLTSWAQPEMGEMSDHDMDSMTGMMSAEDMDGLAAMAGTEFDTMWLEMMIEHHQGAVEMAAEVKADGENPDVATLADQITAAQTTEIAEMETLLGR